MYHTRDPTDGGMDVVRYPIGSPVNYREVDRLVAYYMRPYVAG